MAKESPQNEVKSAIYLAAGVFSGQRKHGHKMLDCVPFVSFHSLFAIRCANTAVAAANNDMQHGVGFIGGVELHNTRNRIKDAKL